MAKQKAVLYIVPNGFYYFQDQFTAVLSVAFPTDIFSDLEIRDQEKFSSLIEIFISSYKLSAASYILILSPWMVFEKDIVADAQQAAGLVDSVLVENIQRFLSLVPFENVASRVFPTPQGIRVVAINEDIVKNVVDPFSRIGSDVVAVVPYFALSGLSSETNGFPLEYALSSLGEFESLKQFNIASAPVIKPKQEISNVTDQDSKEPQKKSNRRLIFLIGTFVILIGILAVVYLTLGTPQNQPVQALIISPSISQASTNISPVATSSTNAVSVSDISVAVYGQEDQGAQIASISSILQNLGVTSITEIIATVSPAKTTILFAKNIPLEQREVFITKLSEIFFGVVTTETETQDSVVRIVLGK